MICDNCIKKTVCKLCDGSEIKGCIEYCRPHEEVLQEIRQEIADLPIASIYRNVIYLPDVLEIIDKHIKEYTK